MEINLGENRLIQNPNQVYHDVTLKGKGTKESPLKVSVDGLNIHVDSDVLTGTGTVDVTFPLIGSSLYNYTVQVTLVCTVAGNGVGLSTNEAFVG